MALLGWAKLNSAGSGTSLRDFLKLPTRLDNDPWSRIKVPKMHGPNLNLTSCLVILFNDMPSNLAFQVWDIPKLDSDLENIPFYNPDLPIVRMCIFLHHELLI